MSEESLTGKDERDQWDRGKKGEGSKTGDIGMGGREESRIWCHLEDGLQCTQVCSEKRFSGDRSIVCTKRCGWSIVRYVDAEADADEEIATAVGNTLT